MRLLHTFRGYLEAEKADDPRVADDKEWQQAYNSIGEREKAAEQVRWSSDAEIHLSAACVCLQRPPRNLLGDIRETASTCTPLGLCSWTGMFPVTMYDYCSVDHQVQCHCRALAPGLSFQPSTSLTAPCHAGG